MKNRISTHPGNKYEVAALWKDIFSDSDDFIDLFFTRVYKPENTLIIKQNDRIVSSLQIIPKELKTGDKTIPAAYICGVCTRKSEQGKGYMKILMNETMETMKERGFIVSTLIPAEKWLFDFYKQFGYINPIVHSIETIGRENFLCRYVGNAQSTKIQEINTIDDFKSVYSFYVQKQKERKCTVLHNEYDFATIIKDSNISEGKILVALNGNIPVGIAFCKTEDDNTALIQEILYNNIDTKKQILNHIFSSFNVDIINIRTPENNTDIQSHEFQPDSIETCNYGLTCILGDATTSFDFNDIYMTLMLD
jgi:predicted acetyltransferase